MKRLLAAIMLAGALAACHGGKGSDSAGAGTAQDTAKAAKDSAKAKSDSMINAASDTLKAK